MGGYYTDEELNKFTITFEKVYQPTQEYLEKYYLEGVVPEDFIERWFEDDENIDTEVINFKEYCDRYENLSVESVLRRFCNDDYWFDMTSDYDFMHTYIVITDDAGIEFYASNLSPDRSVMDDAEETYRKYIKSRSG